MIAASADQIPNGTILEVNISPEVNAPYVETTIRVVRRATRDEFVAYHEANGLKFGPHLDGMNYYEIQMDGGVTK